MRDAQQTRAPPWNPCENWDVIPYICISGTPTKRMANGGRRIHLFHTSAIVGYEMQQRP